MFTQSRLILLDSYLVFSTTLVAMFWALHRRFKDQPFGFGWKASLFGLGVSIALAASCKWVGLFAVAGVGLSTILDLWQIFGDTSVPMRTVFRHFILRAVCLIVAPVAIYASTFYVHFALLTDFTPAASSMSVEFQQTLKGGVLPPTLKQVYYGSVVRIRQVRSDGPFLHSHKHVYPEGSKQQQVTGYHHRDENNLWKFMRPFNVNKTYIEGEDEVFESNELRPLRHGDKFRLMHLGTGRYLHSHPVEPPVSNKEHQNEVSCYGHEESQFSDYNDNWRIEIVNADGDPIIGRDEMAVDQSEENNFDGMSTDNLSKKPPIEAIRTRFRLVHEGQNCRLHSRGKALPEWAYKQIEITCGRDTLRSNSIWLIEHNEHSLIKEEEEGATVEKVSYQPSGFWSKFFELNRRMWDTNAGLSADHPFASRPESWPLLKRGLGFWNGHHVPKPEAIHRRQKEEKRRGKKSPEEEDPPISPEDQAEQARLHEEYRKYKGQQIYLMGNPIVWWSSTAALVIYAVVLVINRFLEQRGMWTARRALEASLMGESLQLTSPAAFFLLQWVLHWVPFFGMNRQLFIHHYLPALYFALLLLAIEIDAGLQGLLALVSRVTGGRHASKPGQVEAWRKWILVALVGMTVYVFWQFAPLGYGLAMTKRQCMRIKWLKRWDWDCESLIDSVGAAIVTSQQ